LLCFQFLIRRRNLRQLPAIPKPVRNSSDHGFDSNTIPGLIYRAVLRWLAAKDDATTVLQVQASAAHGLAQQRPHGADLRELEIKISQLVPGESFPTRRGTRPSTEPVKESPDFCKGKPGFPGKGDGGQAELCVRRKIALAVLAESWWKNSNLFVKTDGGRAKT